MGWVRLLLAIGVFLSHSNEQLLPMITGRFSVTLFFIISGFYMRLVWEEKYSKLSPNLRVRSFYRSRLLRLFPLYLLSVVLILFIKIYTLAPFVTYFQNASWWVQTYTVISNFTLVGQDLLWFLNFDGKVLSWPIWEQLFSNDFSTAHVLAINIPAFSIAVELYFYLLVPYLMRWVKKPYFLGFTILAWVIYLLAKHYMSFRFYYHFSIMNACFFMAGLLIYTGDPLKGFKNFDQQKTRYLLYALNSLVILYAWKMIGNYGTYLFFMWSIPKTFEISRNSKMDRFLGNISYPLFLFHFPIIQYANSLYAFEPRMQIIVNLLMCILICIFLHAVVEKVMTRALLKLIGNR